MGAINDGGEHDGTVTKRSISLEQYTRTVIAPDIEKKERRKLTRADQGVITLCEKLKVERLV